MRNMIAAGLAATFLVAGCASEMQTGAGTESLMTASATVTAVDQSTREVQLAAEDGSVFTVVAGPEVRNLAQLEAGDVVTMDYYQSTALELADPSAPPADAAVLSATAPEGAKPGAMVAETETIVVEVISYDAGVATFRTPDGLTRSAVVPPELRDFAETVSPGQHVRVTMTDAVAVTITESAS